MGDLGFRLEVYVDWLVGEWARRGYRCRGFERLRSAHGARGAIERRVVLEGVEGSGLMELSRRGLRGLSLEATVLRYPGLFSRRVREEALVRLERVRSIGVW